MAPEIESKKKKLQDYLESNLGYKVLLSIEKKSNTYNGQYYDVSILAAEDTSRSTGNFTSVPVGKGESIWKGSVLVKPEPGLVFIEHEYSGRLYNYLNKEQMKEFDTLMLDINKDGISKISFMLDKIADSLEKRGLKKEAEMLDIVANTIENSSAE